MKLLKVMANNYKNCSENFTIDLVAKANKSSEDKEYELQEISEELFVYSTAAFIGKNASGKTSAIDLLDACYSILGEFRLEKEQYHYNFDNVYLEIFFYNEGYIYKYDTVLKADQNFGGKVCFTQEHLYSKKYFKSYARDIYSENGFEEILNLGELPEDTSKVFFVLKKRKIQGVYFDCNGLGKNTYFLLFNIMKSYNISSEILMKIIKIFDHNIKDFCQLEDNRYRLTYQEKNLELSDIELVSMLSSGTTKGVLLYVYVVAALKNGFDLLIDEIENHFHKTLVENIITLFKDKTVNKKGSSLIFTTHYCELLDLFGRQDNIWIAKSEDKIILENMYDKYKIRPELLKSKQYYTNAFDTAINYEDLMSLKKELI